jgi:adenylate cyclase
MPEEKDTTTILFADICGSTRLYERLGDATAQKIVSESLSLLSEVTSKHNGKVIKTIGDEVMCTFPNVSAGIDAACSMQEKIAFMTIPGYGRIAIRIGLHFGTVIRQGNEIFGDAVNVAARIAALAKADEILTTQDTAESLNKGGAHPLRRIQRISLKGKDEAIDIYEVVWQDSSLTQMGQYFVPQGEPSNRLELLTRGQAFTSDIVQKPMVTIGRSKKNDILAEDEFTSRLHARVECRQGKFFLCDQSTNGTYVTYKNGRVVHLHREEMLLPDEGCISLGRKLSPDAEEIIRFRLKHS